MGPGMTPGMTPGATPGPGASPMVGATPLVGESLFLPFGFLGHPAWPGAMPLVGEFLFALPGSFLQCPMLGAMRLVGVSWFSLLGSDVAGSLHCCNRGFAVRLCRVQPPHSDRGAVKPPYCVKPPALKYPDVACCSFNQLCNLFAAWRSLCVFLGPQSSVFCIRVPLSIWVVTCSCNRTRCSMSK